MEVTWIKPKKKRFNKRLLKSLKRDHGTKLRVRSIHHDEKRDNFIVTLYDDKNMPVKNLWQAKWGQMPETYVAEIAGFSWQLLQPAEKQN
jgi:hypothetical protein